MSFLIVRVAGMDGVDASANVSGNGEGVGIDGQETDEDIDITSCDVPAASSTWSISTPPTSISPTTDGGDVKAGKIQLSNDESHQTNLTMSGGKTNTNEQRGNNESCRNGSVAVQQCSRVNNDGTASGSSSGVSSSELTTRFSSAHKPLSGADRMPVTSVPVSMNGSSGDLEVDIDAVGRSGLYFPLVAETGNVSKAVCPTTERRDEAATGDAAGATGRGNVESLISVFPQSTIAVSHDNCRAKGNATTVLTNGSEAFGQLDQLSEVTMGQLPYRKTGGVGSRVENGAAEGTAEVTLAKTTKGASANASAACRKSALGGTQLGSDEHARTGPTAGSLSSTCSAPGYSVEITGGIRRQSNEYGEDTKRSTCLPTAHHLKQDGIPSAAEGRMERGRGGANGILSCARPTDDAPVELGKSSTGARHDPTTAKEARTGVVCQESQLKSTLEGFGGEDNAVALSVSNAESRMPVERACERNTAGQIETRGSKTATGSRRYANRTSSLPGVIIEHSLCGTLTTPSVLNALARGPARTTNATAAQVENTGKK